MDLKKNENECIVITFILHVCITHSNVVTDLRTVVRTWLIVNYTIPHWILQLYRRHRSADLQTLILDLVCCNSCRIYRIHLAFAS